MRCKVWWTYIVYKGVLIQSRIKRLLSRPGIDTYRFTSLMALEGKNPVSLQFVGVEVPWLSVLLLITFRCTGGSSRSFHLFEARSALTRCKMI